MTIPLRGTLKYKGSYIFLCFHKIPIPNVWEAVWYKGNILFAKLNNWMLFSHYSFIKQITPVNYNWNVQNRIHSMSLNCSSSYRVILAVLWSANRAQSGSSLELWASAMVVLQLTCPVCMPECLNTRTGSMSRSPPTSQALLRSPPMVPTVTWQ